MRWSVHRQQELLKHRKEARVKVAHSWVHWAEGGFSDDSNIMWISQITLTGNICFCLCFFTRCKYLPCCLRFCFMLFSFLVWVFHHLNIKMTSLPYWTKECVPVIWDRLLCWDSHLQSALYLQSASLFQCLLHSDLSGSGAKLSITW